MSWFPEYLVGNKKSRMGVKMLRNSFAAAALFSCFLQMTISFVGKMSIESGKH